MVKKGVLFFIVLVVLMIAFLTWSYVHDRQNCLDVGLNSPCSLMEIKIKVCSDDCMSLGKNYFRAEIGGIFANDECWCLEDNESVQIW